MEFLYQGNGCVRHLPADPYFGILHKHGVRFYDASYDVEWLESEYGDDGKFVDIFALGTDAEDEVVVTQAQEVIDWASVDPAF